MEIISSIRKVQVEPKGIVQEELIREASDRKVANVKAARNMDIDRFDLVKTIALINSQLKEQKLELTYEKHEKTNQLVARLQDSETKEIIREVPPKKLLDYRANMNELLGILLDQTI